MCCRAALLRAVCLMVVCLLSSGRLASCAVIFVPYNDSTCSTIVPSLPTINLPVYNTSLSYFNCVPFSGVIETFSSQPAQWLWSSCYDTAFITAGVRIYYYSIGGMCPLASGRVDVYPPNITYTGSRANGGICAGLEYSIVSGSDTNTGQVYTNSTCNTFAYGGTSNNVYPTASHLVASTALLIATALFGLLFTY